MLRGTCEVAVASRGGQSPLGLGLDGQMGEATRGLCTSVGSIPFRNASDEHTGDRLPGTGEA